MLSLADVELPPTARQAFAGSFTADPHPDG